MENVASFSAHNVEFGSFFEGRIPYRIPRFQRPYSWDQDHVFDFWTDLTNDSNQNFIGSFVFNYEYAGTEKRIDIIDGQQRFLTTTIFSAAIRDYFREELKSERDADFVQRRNISFENEDGTYMPRIQVGDSAREFFESYIQNEVGGTATAPTNTAEEQLIRGNYKYFRERLDAFAKNYDSPKEKIKAILGLLSKLKDSYVIHIKIASEEDAFEIFETVNARGVELSVADLLKNLVFKKITEGKTSSLAEVHTEWTEMLLDLEDTGFDVPKFIRYYWLSASDFVGSKGLFKSIKRKTENYRKLLDSLKDNASRLSQLTNPSEEELAKQFPKYGGRITRALRGLRLMRVTQCYVFLLALLRNSDHITPKRLKEVVVQVESFSFLYSLITKGPGNRVERLYSKYAIKLDQASKIGDASARAGEVGNVIASLLEEMRKLIPPYDQFQKGFVEIKYAQSSKARQIVGYILSKIDAHLSTDELIPDFEMVNIEHVMPQKPASGWKVSRKELQECVNQLGNLTLVSKKINSTIGNGPLQVKLNELEKSALPVTQRLVKSIREAPAPYQWGRKEILARQERLADLAYNGVWKF